MFKALSAILLLAGAKAVDGSAIISEFAVVVTKQGDADFPSLSDIGEYFEQAIFQTTHTPLNNAIAEKLATPDTRFNLEQAAFAQTKGKYQPLIDARMDILLVYTSNTEIHPLPTTAVIQKFGRALAKDFQGINGVGFVFEGQQEKAVYLFPQLVGQRRRPNAKSQEIIDYWTAERIASATFRDYELDGNGRRRLHKGRNLQLEINNDAWLKGGIVQTAVGRLLFTMPDGNFICSGTVVTETATDRSIIITAAHCAYDDQYKAFASYTMFIPNQDATTGTATNFRCDDDPLGCWTTSFAVVDENWSSRVWSANYPYDYAYYVVNDSGSRSGDLNVPETLDQASTPLPIDFGSNPVGTYTHAMGYPGKFRYLNLNGGRLLLRSISRIMLLHSFELCRRHGP